MLLRIVAFLVIAAALTAALLYSQQHKAPDKFSGFIEAHDIRVGSRLGGRILKVNVVEGQLVHTGDLLLELEPFDLRDRLAEAQATLAQRQAQLTRLQTGFRPEEIAQSTAHRDQLKAELDKMKTGPRPQEIAEAQALSDQAISQRNLAQQTFERVSKAFANNSTSQDEMDQATNNLKVAQSTATVRAEQLALLKEGSRAEDIAAAAAQLAEAQEALTLQKNGNRAEDIAAAKASVDAQQAVIAALQKQIDELRITSPADATVETIDLRPGDLLPPNAPALSLIETSTLWVRAYIPENRLNVTTAGTTPTTSASTSESRASDGQKVRVTVDSFPGKSFEGTITFLSRNAEFTPNNIQTPEERSKQVFRIRVTLNDPDHVLRAGMSADVWLK